MSVMQWFVEDNDLHRIELEEDQWIDVKRLMNAGDWEKLQENLVNIDVEGTIEDEEPHLTHAQKRIVKRKGG